MGRFRASNVGNCAPRELAGTILARDFLNRKVVGPSLEEGLLLGNTIPSGSLLTVAALTEGEPFLASF